MNCGVADAQSLAWCLTAALEGWGGPAVLDAYEAERMPVISSLSLQIKAKASAVAGDRRNVPVAITQDDAAGEQARQEFGRQVYEHNVEQFCAAGLNFGYSYEQSPIIAYDGADLPPFSMGTYEEAIAPGARFPHAWLDGERSSSLYDELGRGFTLFARAGCDTGPMARAAEELSVPLTVAELPDSIGDRWADGSDLYLVRPDAHLVWRGSADESDPKRVLAKVAGWET
jgi:hypothetical protein